MASNSIAKASLELTANSGGLNKGLDDAKRRIEEWSKVAKAKLKELDSDRIGQLHNRLKSVQSALPVLIPASLFAGMAIFNKITDAVEQLGLKLRQTVNDARAIGTGLAGLQRLQYAAKAVGIEAKTVNAAIGTMFTVLRSGQRPEAINKLGLDLDKLKHMDAEDGITSVIEAVNRLSDPMDRARAVTALFGDQAQAMLPLLGKGADGFKQLTEEAKKLGIGMDDDKAARLLKVQESITRLNTAWEQVRNELLIGLVPALEMTMKVSMAVTTAIAQKIMGLTPMIEKLTLTLLKYIVLGQALGVIPSLVDKDTDKSNKDIEKRIKAMEQLAGKVSGIIGNIGNKPNQIGNGLNAQVIDIAKSINEAETALRNKMKSIGFTAGEQMVFDLKLKGASEKDLWMLKGYAQEAKNVEIAFNNIQMPALETFERSLKGLQMMRVNGRLNEEQGKLGLFNAAKNLMQATLTQPQAVAPAIKDSQEAASAIINARMQEQRQDPQAELRRAMMEAKEIQKKQLQTAEKMLEVLKENKDFDLEAL